MRNACQYEMIDKHVMAVSAGLDLSIESMMCLRDDGWIQVSSPSGPGTARTRVSWNGNAGLIWTSRFFAAHLMPDTMFDTVLLPFSFLFRDKRNSDNPVLKSLNVPSFADKYTRNWLSALLYPLLVGGRIALRAKFFVVSVLGPSLKTSMASLSGPRSRGGWGPGGFAFCCSRCAPLFGARGLLLGLGLAGCCWLRSASNSGSARSGWTMTSVNWTCDGGLCA